MPALFNAIAMPALLALVVSTAVIALLIRSRAMSFALDHPNHRSLHTAPTPRLGGVGIIAGVAAAWWVAEPQFDQPLVLAFVLLTGISLIDDLKGVAVGWRFTVHFAGALLAMSALLYPAYGPWIILTAALATTWMINLYNFMDGSDGLAGGMAVCGFGTYGAAALIGGDFLFAALNLAVATAALGFLLFNFPPARIFMGDAGAIPLGYLAAVLGIMGWLRGDWPLWFGAMVFSPFIVDATVTLVRRGARGARVWQAHREHYYQRLVQCGWGHRKTALAEYGLMLACGVAAIVGSRGGVPVRFGVVAGVVLLYVVLIVALERGLRRQSAPDR